MRSRASHISHRPSPRSWQARLRLTVGLDCALRAQRFYRVALYRLRRGADVRQETRRPALTERGCTFHTPARAMLAAAHEIRVTATGDEPGGTLRVPVPVTFGRLAGVMMPPPTSSAPRRDRASEPLDEWDCVDELVDEEAWSEELVV